MEYKGREFKGMTGGAWYDRMAVMFGMGTGFYAKAMENVKLSTGQRVLDLGCGTGSTALALARMVGSGVHIDGIDISDTQLNHARNKASTVDCQLTFHNCSMDELSFADETFDLVIASMSLHETPEQIRRRALAEVSRVLKPGGDFILVEWSRPKPGIMSAVWLPFLFFGQWRDNWYNTYADICSNHGLHREADHYLNSLLRRQVFHKN